MKPREAKLSHEELTRRLDYNPQTGIFMWKIRPSNSAKMGIPVGWKAEGYVHVEINGMRYKAHRLAWFYVHKKWPENEIDHINLVKDDNRIANLREATRSQNCRNNKLRSNNSTGFKGVTRHKFYEGKFMAQIKLEHRNKYLGIFDTAEEAHVAYVRASQEHHEEFGRSD